MNCVYYKKSEILQLALIASVYSVCVCVWGCNLFDCFQRCSLISLGTSKETRGNCVLAAFIIHSLLLVWQLQAFSFFNYLQHRKLKQKEAIITLQFNFNALCGNPLLSTLLLLYYIRFFF